MDSHSVMTTLIDPRLQMMDPVSTMGDMHYHLSTSFEPWSGLFESLDFPAPAQGMGAMGGEFQSDSASPLSPMRQNDHGFDSPLSPLEDMLDLDGPTPTGDTSASTRSSESGTSVTSGTSITSGTDVKASKTTTKPKPGRRRRRSETEKRDIIKQRNRVAASKCRQKKKEKVDELKDIKATLERRNSELQLEYQRLRQELGQVKSHLIRHTDCSDPNIDRWVENEAKCYVQKLVHKGEQRRVSSVGSISSTTTTTTDGGFDGIRRTQSLNVTAMPSEDPYMGSG